MSIGATQKWYAGAAVASVAVLGAGWFLLVSPQQSTAAEITAQAEIVASANQTTMMQIQTLKEQFKDLPVLQGQLDQISAHLPSAPNEPALLRTLSSAATKAGVSLVSVQLQAPAPMTVPGAAPPAAGTNAFTVPGQISQIPLTMEISGSFANTQLFLNSLEGQQRVVLVTGLDITRDLPTGKTTGLRTVLAARVFMANPGTYVLPSAEPVTAGADTSNQAS